MSTIRRTITPESAARDARRGWRNRAGAALLRTLKWARKYGNGLAWLYSRVPFTWRQALRRRVHAAAGTPLGPLLPPEAGARSRRTHRVTTPPTRPGVNLLGYARGEFGVAENVRACARSLEHSGYPFLMFNLDVGTASRQQDHSMDRYFSDTLDHAINAFFINADQMSSVRSLLGKRAFRGHHNIGFWAWELEKFPQDWRGAFDLVDEVWTPTAFVRDAIAAATHKPVTRMPLVIDPALPVGMDRAHFGLPGDEFVFLFSFDFNGFAARKNPEAVIKAFRQAFGGGVEGVKLLLKTSNGQRFPDQLAAIQRSIADDPRIELRDGFLSRAEMSGLQNVVDCFVSLHRAEGFGLNLAECMYFGKPVIATGYSGNLDFMDDENSLLVDFRMIALHDGDYPYSRGQQWADPSVAHASKLMQQVHNDPDLARRIGATAAARIRRSHSLASSAAAITARLVEIDGKLPVA